MTKPSSSSSPAANPGFDFSKLVSPTELAEGGGFGPTSFRGAVIGSAYGPHRFTPKDGFKPDADASYFMALHLKFRVDEVLDTESGYDPDDHPEGFDYPVKLGGKSLRYLFATNDTRTPAGIEDGFEEQALLAAGRSENGQVITLTKPPIEQCRGRWLFPIPGIPEGKGKIEPKSGYNQMLEASAPAIAAVDPSEVVKHTDKKGNEILTLPANSNSHLAADGLPSGALYFLGLSGIWDTKKIPLEGLKDEKGNTQVQKVLFLTSYDGREDIPIPEGMGGAAGAVAASGAEPKAGKKSASTSAAKKPEPAATSVAPPATESESDSDAATGPEGDDLDSQVIRAILAELPISGAIKQKDLAMKVVPKFPAAERVNAGQAFLRVIKTNTKETAQGLADMGMDGDVYFTYDEKSQSVERWSTTA